MTVPFFNKATGYGWELANGECNSNKLCGGKDVAILTLEFDIHYSTKVRPICLPSGVNNYANEYALSAGFGLHEFNATWNNPYPNGNRAPKEGLSPFLFKTKMKVLSTAQCNQEYKLAKIDPSVFNIGRLPPSNNYGVRLKR